MRDVEPPVVACHGFPHAAVSSIDPLASQAALTVLRRGGSSVDAAIAANAVLAVVAPDACGLGGDVVGLVYQPRTPRTPPRVHALVGIGRAGSNANAEILREQGFRTIPRDHPAAITVPGAVDGWLLAHERFGRLALDTILADAIDYARNGFAAPARLAAGARELSDLGFRSELTAAFKGRFVPGQRIRHHGIARTLEAITRLGREGFYAGEVGAELMALTQGALRAEDLARPQAELVEPIAVDALGLRMMGTPAPSASFLTLGLLAALPPERPTSLTQAYLEMVDAIEQTRWLHELHYDGADVAAALAAPAPSSPPATLRRPNAPDTTAIVVVDHAGGACVLVQSNANAFGTRLTTHETGVFVHSRGAVGFDLDPASPNQLGPRRRPRHTLAPLMATDPRTGTLRLVAGTMGGDRQPTVIAQVVSATLREGIDPRTALARARLAETAASSGPHPGFDTHHHDGKRTWVIEDHVDPSVLGELAERIGPLTLEPGLTTAAGVCHIAMVREHDVISCSDPRAEDGSAIGW